MERATTGDAEGARASIRNDRHVNNSVNACIAFIFIRVGRQTMNANDSVFSSPFGLARKK